MSDNENFAEEEIPLPESDKTISTLSPQLLVPDVTMEEEQEILLAGSTSSSSSGDFDNVQTPQTRRSDSDVIERLMTEKEIEELDKRLEEVVNRLQKQRDDYEQWENDLNARRLKAFGRLKALGRSHKRRLELYETMKEYLQKKNGQPESKISDKFNT